MAYIIVFRPQVRVIGPPGDGRLTLLLRELVEAGRKAPDEGRFQAVQVAQESLITAGLNEEKVSELSRLLLVALHPKEVRVRTVLPDRITVEVDK